MGEIFEMKSFKHPQNAGIYNAALIAKDNGKNIEDWIKLESTQISIILVGFQRGSAWKLPDNTQVNFEMFESNMFPDTIRFERDSEFVWISEYLLPCLLRWCCEKKSVDLDIELVELAKENLSDNEDLAVMLGYFV